MVGVSHELTVSIKRCYKVDGLRFTLITGEMSNILQKALVPPVDHADCNENFGKRAFKQIIETQICAGDGSGKDTCQVQNYYYYRKLIANDLTGEICDYFRLNYLQIFRSD